MTRLFFLLSALFITLSGLPALAGEEAAEEETRSTSEGPAQELVGGLLDETPAGRVVDTLAHDEAEAGREAAREVDQELTPEE
ncbi:MAG: hypothetical protein AB1938_08290 [Myxococcota bacterium]